MDHVCASADDGGRLVLIAGEPGVGKTRLVAEMAAVVLNLDFTILYGRCEQQPLAPYEPFIEALRGPAAEGRLDSLSIERRASLARMLPELDAPPAALGQLGGEFERLGLFDAVSGALAAASMDGPAVLVIDDLQWAEGSTLQLLRYLGDGLARRPLVIVGTERDAGRASRDELDEIARRSRSEVLRLGGLDDRAVIELVSEWADRASPEQLASDLAAETGGNPLLLRPLLETITERAGYAGELPARLPPDALVRMPRDIVGSIRQRVNSLGPPTCALLTAGALIGREFALDEAAGAARLTLDEAAPAMDVALAAGLVRTVEGARPVLLRFERALVRHALGETLGPTERALLHLRIAQAIESRPSARVRPAELAQHFQRARRVGGGEQALRYARKAAEAAADRLAFDEAAQHLETALAAIDGLGRLDWRERYDVLIELGVDQHRSAGAAAARPSFSRAATLALEHGDEKRAAGAALEAGVQRYLRPPGTVDAPAIDRLERGLAAAGREDVVLRARLLTAVAHERTLLDPLEQRIGAAEAALAEARRSGDSNALFEALIVEQSSTWSPARSEALMERATEMLALAAELRRPDLIAHVHRRAAALAFELDREEEVERHTAAAVSAAEALRDPAYGIDARAVEMMRRLLRGELKAREELERMLSELEPSRGHLLADDPLIWSFSLDRESDQLEGLRPGLEAAVAAAPGAAWRRAILAEACARTKDIDAARAQLEALDRHGFERISEEPMALATLAMAATAAVLCADAGRAERLYHLLSPWAGRNAVIGLAAVDRPVHHVLGLLASVLGRPEDALAHFDAAETAAAKWGALPWLGHALCERGITLRRLGRRAEARHVLRRALDVAGQYPGEVLRRRARKELVALGIRPRRERLEGPGALTRSELRVVQLAARGKTNSEIAQLLTLSRRTVETHLTSAYRKLGIERRAQLAEALEREEPTL